MFSDPNWGWIYLKQKGRGAHSRRPQPPLGWRWGNGSADLRLLRNQEPAKTGWREGEERGFQGRPAQTETEKHQ